MTRRPFILISSVLIQTCLGGMFAWSVYSPPLMAEYGLNAAAIQSVLGVTVATFAVTMLYAGRLQERIGPRPVAALGGLLFGSGYLLASAAPSYAAVLGGMGLLMGAGIGFGYVCPLATCVRWFPRRKGLITGISVAGFGAGAIVLSNGVQFLLQTMPLAAVLRTVGVAYGSAIIVGALFLAFPPGSADSPPAAISPGRILRSRRFWPLFAGMFAGTFAGLMIIGNLKPIGLTAGLPETAATLGISSFAVGNAAGRMAWGWIFDRIALRAIPASLLALAAAIAPMAFLPAASTPVFLLLTVLIGFGLGSCYVVYPGAVCTAFGAERLGSVYPFVFLGFGASALLGQPLAGALFDHTGRYTLVILLAALTAAAGALLTLILRPAASEIHDGR